jgi:hypothetical protein
MKVKISTRVEGSRKCRRESIEESRVSKVGEKVAWEPKVSGVGARVCVGVKGS